MSRSRSPLNAPRPPTIIDVASAAGLSVSTVSRVIRAREDVSDDTRRRVQRVMADLGYRPSAVARALVAGFSKTIALLVSDIANPAYPQLAKSIEREASRHGYALAICNTEDDPVEAVALAQRMMDQGVEGMLHASVGLEEERILAVVGDLRRIVFANRRPRADGVSYIGSDDHEGGVLLARHLLATGHRRIGFVAGPSWAFNSADRMEGMASAVHESGAELLVAQGDFSMESGASAVRGWLDSGHPPTAIVGVNDVVALGVMRELRADDNAPRIAVAGFDDTELAGSDIIGLTSVAQHIGRMGEQAVQVLLRQLAGRTHPPVRTILRPTLRVRSTTAALCGPFTEVGRLPSGSCLADGEEQSAWAPTPLPTLRDC